MPRTLADPRCPRKCKTHVSVQRLYFPSIKSGHMVQPCQKIFAFYEFKILES